MNFNFKPHSRKRKSATIAFQAASFFGSKALCLWTHCNATVRLQKLMNVWKQAQANPMLSKTQREHHKFYYFTVACINLGNRNFLESTLQPHGKIHNTLHNANRYEVTFPVYEVKLSGVCFFGKFKLLLELKGYCMSNVLRINHAYCQKTMINLGHTTFSRRFIHKAPRAIS